MGWSVALQPACVLPLCLVRCYKLLNHCWLTISNSTDFSPLISPLTMTSTLGIGVDMTATVPIGLAQALALALISSRIDQARAIQLTEP